MTKSPRARAFEPGPDDPSMPGARQIRCLNLVHTRTGQLLQRRRLQDRAADVRRALFSRPEIGRRDWRITSGKCAKCHGTAPHGWDNKTADRAAGVSCWHCQQKFEFLGGMGPRNSLVFAGRRLRQGVRKLRKLRKLWKPPNGR